MALRELAWNGPVHRGADDGYADGEDSAWLNVDWPALTRRIELFDRPVSVVDTGGNGVPLLFVHGLAGRWQNWLLNIPPFMGSHRVIAPDLPGFGQSPMPRDPISIQGYAKILDALCRALDVQEAIMVGNSMGGFVSAELALAFSTRVRKLVLVSAAGLSIEYQRREPLLTLARLWSVVTARGLTRAEFVIRRPRSRRAALQMVVRYPERLSGPIAWELVQGTGRPGFMPALQALLAYSFRDRLAQIEIPVLIVWGRNDMLVPVDDAEEYERLIGPNARKEIFEDTGHVPMIERPQRFNELLAGFIEGEDAPEAGVEGVSARAPAPTVAHPAA